MQLFRQLVLRFRAWRHRGAVEAIPAALISMGPPILRDVSAGGVRVYSLCGSCGSRLEVSATLCDACAQRRSSSPF